MMSSCPPHHAVTLHKEVARDRVWFEQADRHLMRRIGAYGYFEPLGDLVITGPTNTN
jgi:glycerate-2-kinase